MLIGPALLLLLAAGPVKLAAPGFSCEGVSPRVCSAYLERFSALLAGPRLKVTTAGDVASILGLERQKQLLGCGESSCLAELAGALGVEGLLTGSVVRTPSSGWLVTLKVVRTRDGGTWTQATVRARSEEEMQGFLDRTAGEFRTQLGQAAEPVEVAAKVAAPSPLVPWIPAMAGGALLLGGTAVFVVGKVDAGRLAAVGTLLPPDQVLAIARRGALEEQLGLALGAVGLAGIAASLVWSQLTPMLQVAGVPLAGGGALVLGGAW
jgi:hypothetical protein